MGKDDKCRVDIVVPVHLLEPEEEIVAAPDPQTEPTQITMRVGEEPTCIVRVGDSAVHVVKSLPDSHLEEEE